MRPQVDVGITAEGRVASSANANPIVLQLVLQVPVHQTLKELLFLRAELQRRVEELQREASIHSLSSSEHTPSPTHTSGTPLHTAVWPVLLRKCTFVYHKYCGVCLQKDLLRTNSFLVLFFYLRKRGLSFHSLVSLNFFPLFLFKMSYYSVGFFQVSVPDCGGFNGIVSDTWINEYKYIQSQFLLYNLTAMMRVLYFQGRSRSVKPPLMTFMRLYFVLYREKLRYDSWHTVALQCSLS